MHFLQKMKTSSYLTSLLLYCKYKFVNAVWRNDKFLRIYTKYVNVLWGKREDCLLLRDHT
jgi:hypothetical protein